MQSDGYHRCLVLIASFLTMTIYVGVYYSQAPLFVATMQKFSATRAEASLVSSLVAGLGGGLGVVCGPLIHRFDRRPVMFLGALFAAGGFLASAFATSLLYLTLTSGVVVGIGFCPVNIGIFTAVGQKFRGKHRAMVLSFVNTGSGVGVAVVPHLIGYVNDVYGYQGVYIILGGLYLQGCIAAMLMFPERATTRKKPPDSVSEDDGSKTADAGLGIDNKAFNEYNNRQKLSSFTKTSDENRLQGSMVSESNRHECDTISVFKDNVTNRDKTETRNIKVNMRGKTSVIIHGTIKFTRSNDGNQRSAQSIQHVYAEPKDTVEDPYNGKISISHSTAQSGELSYDSVLKLSDKEYDKTYKEHIEPSTIKSVRFLIRQKMFWMFALGMALVFPTLMVLPIFIVDLCRDVGITGSEGAYALSLINIASGIGRFLPGVILKIPKMQALGVPIIAGFIDVISVCTVATFSTVTPIYVFSFTFGLAHGIFITTYSVVTLELFGEEHFPNSIGIIFTINAIVGAAFGPIGGYIRDTTQQYSIVLFLFAGMAMVANIVFIVAEALRRKTHRTSHQKHRTVYETKL